MENEPQELFDIYLKSSNLSINEYVKQNHIKGLYVLVNNRQGYSKIDFDEKGNLTSYTLIENRPIVKKEILYNSQNKIEKINYYDKSETLIYGTFNIFKNDSIFTYSLKDSFLRELSIKANNIEINVLYDDNKNETIRLEKHFGDNGELLKEILIDNGIATTKQFEYLDDSKYSTVIKTDSDNNEISKEKYLSQKKIPQENITEFYEKDTEKPFKIETTVKDKLLSELYLDEKGIKYKEIVYRYSDRGLLENMKLINYKTKETTEYIYSSNRKGWLTDIRKKSKRKSLLYNFKVLLKEK